MQKLSFAFVMAMPLMMAGTTHANEQDACWRRPIENILGSVADHSYCWKYCTCGTCNTASLCGCGTQSDCNYQINDVEHYGTLWGYQCADWIYAAHSGGYGTWG